MRSLLNRKMFIILNQILVKIFLLDNRQRHFKTCDLSWVWNYFHKTKLRKTKLNVWPRVTLSISCKAKISKHVQCSRMDCACQLCSRSKTRQILPHLWPRVHIFNSSNTEISKHLTRSKMDRVFKFGLRSKNSSKYLIVYATGIATLK